MALNFEQEIIKERDQMILLLANFNNPLKDLLAATLAWMCKESGWYFDVYYCSGSKLIKRDNDQHHHKSDEGGLFSAHGSSLLGGRHYQALNRVMAEFEVTVINLDKISLFGTLIRSAAKQIIVYQGIVELLKTCTSLLGCNFPEEAVVVQTEDLPENFSYGVAQYLYPAVVYRKALGLPLSLSAEEIAALKSAGLEKVSFYSFTENLGVWDETELKLEEIEILTDDNYGNLTFRLLDKWGEQAAAYDLCEPILASYWLPYAVQKNRLQVCSEKMIDAATRLAPLVEAKGEKVVYGRYAGGPICRADDDEDLFPLFERNISYQVLEPGRPVFRVFPQKEKQFPQANISFTELGPSDEQLLVWARKGMILTTLLFHSGELSHDDGIMNVLELSALTKVKVGIPVHLQRYTFDPDCVEAMHVSVQEGGMLGLCEPVLHSSGLGIITEERADPDKVAAVMKEARDSIANIVGEGFAPQGVYCYLDTSSRNWNKKQERLWRKIGEQGFKYLLTSVQPGNSAILYQDSNITVVNLQCDINYPYSPFVRVNSVAQMVEMERDICRTGKPGWLNAVIDSPIFASSSYLLKGKSRPTVDKAALYPNCSLGSFFEYIAGGGETHKIVSATPHTIYRYATLLKEKGYI